MIKIQRDKPPKETATVTFTGMTAGQMLALLHALELHQRSPIAAELRQQLEPKAKAAWPHLLGDNP